MVQLLTVSPFIDAVTRRSTWGCAHDDGQQGPRSGNPPLEERRWEIAGESGKPSEKGRALKKHPRAVPSLRMPDGRVFPLAVYLPFGGICDFLHHPVSRSTSVTDVENRLQHGRYAPTPNPGPSEIPTTLSSGWSLGGSMCVPGSGSRL